MCLFSASLSEYLRSHPALNRQKGKEPHFFDTEKFEKGLKYYRSLMSKMYPHQLTYEKVRWGTDTFKESFVTENSTGVLTAFSLSVKLSPTPTGAQYISIKISGLWVGFH